MTNIGDEVSDAVEWYWETLSDQGEKHRDSENTARGRRAQVLGGSQMDGFAGLVEDALVAVGVPRDDVQHDHDAVLPGYFRATKRWDIAVVHEGKVLAAIEFKSIASSFSNNLNNRAEEALGNSIDLRKAYENDIIEQPRPPWVGYLILLKDCEAVRSPVNVREPNISIDEEYRGLSYTERFELLCQRSVRQGVVDASVLLTSSKDEGLEGGYDEPNPYHSFQHFLDDLVAHVEPQIEYKQTELDIDD